MTSGPTTAATAAFFASPSVPAFTTVLPVYVLANPLAKVKVLAVAAIFTTIAPAPEITPPTPVLVIVLLPNVTLLLPLTVTAPPPVLRTMLFAIETAALDWIVPPLILNGPTPIGPFVIAVAVAVLLLPRSRVPLFRV